MKYGYLVWKSVWHKPGRTVLTLLSMLAAFLLLGVMQTVGYSLSHPSPAFGSDTLIVFNKSSIGQTLPYAYLQDLVSMTGVGHACVADSLVGYYRDPKKPITVSAVDIDSYFAIRRNDIEVAAAQLQAMTTTRNGAIIGPDTAEKYGWKVGDLVNLHANGNFVRSDGAVDWPFVVVGILKIRNPSDRGLFGERIYIDYHYLDEGRVLGKSKAQMFMVQPPATTAADELARSIDAHFANSPQETRSMPMKSLVMIMLRQVGDIGFIINSITTAVLVTLAFMIGNAMMHTFYERIPEFATLKAIGYSDRLVMLLVIAESLMTCAVGAAMGIGGAWLLIPLLRKEMMGVDLTPTALLPGVAMALLLAIAVALIPALRVRRLQVVDALAARQ
jgi:putative ABC transport system permease protein